jgi:quercetin dioxygenase-like cupin family protein
MRFVEKEKLPVGKFHMGNCAFDTTIVFGNACSIMMAERPSGYHSKPHIHECEQLNLVMKGELILFIEGEGRLLKEGDYSRVPANAMHWSWNQSDKPIVLLEIHSPGLQNDPKCSEYAYPLFNSDEKVEVTGKPVNIFPPDSREIETLIKRAEAPFTK